MEKSVVENNEMESKGFELTLANPFFKDLIELMEEPKFTRFFNTYFKDMSDIKATLIYMKLYITYIPLIQPQTIFSTSHHSKLNVSQTLN